MAVHRRSESPEFGSRSPRDARRSALSPRVLARTEGTVTKGAVNFAQICATLANTMDLHLLLLPTILVNFAQIRSILFLSAILGLTPPFITPPFVRFQAGAAGQRRGGRGLMHPP